MKKLLLPILLTTALCLGLYFSPLVHAAKLYPYNVDKVFSVVAKVLSVGVWFALESKEGVSYRGVKILREGRVGFELTAEGKDKTFVDINGPKIILDAVHAELKKLGKTK
ncbi:hypothetical protein ACFL2Q_06450 [Thermodesulfobacteriota bacterium]